MAIQASGAVSFSDLRSEFIGGSGAVSFSDLYRGGSYIRNNAANNTATNLAASVPTSGAISFSNFYSQAKGFRKTYTAGATSQNGNVIFGSDWGVNYPKEIVINSGVELGTTNINDWALELNSGSAGTITVTNAGIITGAGGAANGGAGGDAVRVNCSNVTIVNTGTIRGGGGGGGKGGNGGTGGTGGQGSVTTTGGTVTVFSGLGQNCNICTSPYNGQVYVNMSCNSYKINKVDYQTDCYGQPQTTTIYNGGSGGSGGAGGNGGVGAGYGQSATSGSAGAGGSSGSGGGTNAGSGGTGGTGGTGGAGGGFGSNGAGGANGNTGASGANGNYSNGSGGSGGASGSGGGAAGRAVQRDVAYTMSNSGTIQGAYT